MTLLGKSDSGFIYNLDRYMLNNNVKGYLILDVDNVGAHNLIKTHLPEAIAAVAVESPEAANDPETLVGMYDEACFGEYHLKIVTSESSGLWGSLCIMEAIPYLEGKDYENIKTWLQEFVFGNI